MCRVGKREKGERESEIERARERQRGRERERDGGLGRLRKKCRQFSRDMARTSPWSQMVVEAVLYARVCLSVPPRI